MRQKLILIIATLLVIPVIGVIASSASETGDEQTAQQAQTVAGGRTMHEKYGALPSRSYVVKGRIVGKGIRRIGSLKDAEPSENATERAQQVRYAQDDRWLAAFDVDVSEWVDGRGTQGNGPRAITVLHGVSFTTSDDRAGVTLSGDWTDRALYDELNVDDEYEFHIVTESLYGKYYGLLFAFPITDGKVSDTDIRGKRMRDYRYAPPQGPDNDS